ncbi:MAG: hypothetical protein E7647_08770 [Ruminococcaceae bacterium]|nr:hypothetical protein [Oscillospiraceae bacterium]
MMTAVPGALLLCAAAFLWGRERGRLEEEKLSLLLGFISFVEYTKEQITVFKTPLDRIFSDYCSKELEGMGFIKVLREKGATDAVKLLQGKIPEEAFLEGVQFCSLLGGGYTEGQKKLCEVTLARLEKTADELRALIPGRVRMYRLLPVLIAASVIILLI